VQVRLRRLDRFMTEPQRDHGAVDAGLQQFHCVSAWNKDPVIGVIGVQSGPPH
jgi:hypothetical protein